MVPGDFLCNEGSVLDAVLYLGDAGALNIYRIGKKKMLHRQKNRGVGVVLNQLLGYVVLCSNIKVKICDNIPLQSIS